jgi:hypothetical protein
MDIGSLFIIPEVETTYNKSTQAKFTTDNWATDGLSTFTADLQNDAYSTNVIDGAVSDNGTLLGEFNNLAGGSVTAIAQQSMPTYDIDKFKIQLVGKIGGDRVIFATAPQFAVTRRVHYTPQMLLHMPGNYQIYENTLSRQFEFSEIKLISRNSKEARANLDILNILNGWTQPFFGKSANMSNVLKGSADVSNVQNYAGAPPEILYLSAYSTINHLGHLCEVPVVIADLTITYPNDCDYIPTYGDDLLGGTPFPMVCVLTLSLLEQHSPAQFEQFDLSTYKAGLLVGF